MTNDTETAILAGGCFWGMQELLRHRHGVISTRVGYTGGQNENRTEDNHPGHAEAVEILFDPGRTCYRDMLEFFFQIHDPTTRDRQGENTGSDYRSEIFCTTAGQRQVAEDTIADVEASGLWPGKIVTQISDAGPFWAAEAEDQDYLQRHTDGTTCHFPRPGWKLPRRYQSEREDSTRWLGFPFRDGDIVISTPSKTGTTWAQMICALLIFAEPRLPAPLGRLSPWLDHLIVSREQVHGLLAAQQHRRFIKTHTPLDGLPLDLRASYLVTARHPLDVAVSLYHHRGNVDEAPWRQLTGEPEPPTPPPPPEPLHDWLLRWIADDTTDPAEDLDTLPGLMWHLTDAWARRGEPNILLVHYDNLSADLDGQMRWLAGQLGITIPERAWPALVRAATFENMSRHADMLVPSPGLFKSNAAFFHRGSSGAGREILSDAELADYHARVTGMAPRDMLAWPHSPRPGGVTEP